MPITSLTREALEKEGLVLLAGEMVPRSAAEGLLDSSAQPQGFKLHVSASRANMNVALPAVLNRLIELGSSRQLTFKLIDPDSFEKMLDEGNKDGKGKFITIYPWDRQHAIEVAAALHDLLEDDHVAIPGDQQVFAGKNLYVRFGVFSDFHAARENGRDLTTKQKLGKLRTPGGQVLPDPRDEPFPADTSVEKEKFPNEAHRRVVQRGAASPPAAAAAGAAAHPARTLDPVDALVERFGKEQFERLKQVLERFEQVSDPDANDEPAVEGVEIGRRPNDDERRVLIVLAAGVRTPKTVNEAKNYFRDAQLVAKRGAQAQAIRRPEAERRRAPPPQ